MSRESRIEIVRRSMEARAQNDVDAVVALMTDDVEIDLSRRVVDPMAVHGHDGFRRFIEVLTDAWASQTIEPYDMVEIGDQVVAPVRLTSVGRSSGPEVKALAAWVVSFRDDKVCRLCVYQSREEALEAVGLSE